MEYVTLMSNPESENNNMRLQQQDSSNLYFEQKQPLLSRAGPEVHQIDQISQFMQATFPENPTKTLSTYSGAEGTKHVGNTQRTSNEGHVVQISSNVHPQQKQFSPFKIDPKTDQASTATQSTGVGSEDTISADKVEEERGHGNAEGEQDGVIFTCPQGKGSVPLRTNAAGDHISNLIRSKFAARSINTPFSRIDRKASGGSKEIKNIPIHIEKEEHNSKSTDTQSTDLGADEKEVEVSQPPMLPTSQPPPSKPRRLPLGQDTIAPYRSGSVFSREPWRYSKSAQPLVYKPFSSATYITDASVKKPQNNFGAIRKAWLEKNMTSSAPKQGSVRNVISSSGSGNDDEDNKESEEITVEPVKVLVHSYNDQGAASSMVTEL